MKPAAVPISGKPADAQNGAVIPVHSAMAGLILELADLIRAGRMAAAPEDESLVNRFCAFIDGNPGRANNRAIALAHGLKETTIRNHFGPKLRARGYTCGRGGCRSSWRKNSANCTNCNRADVAIAKPGETAKTKRSRLHVAAAKFEI